MKFSYQKYREWRKSHEDLDDDTLDIIDRFTHFKDMDGKDYDELWKQGEIVLKQWCDDEKETN